MLSALATLRLEDQEACDALGERLAQGSKSLQLPHLALALRAFSRLPVAKSTIDTCVRAAAHVKLPGVRSHSGVPEGEPLRALAMLCNALLQLGSPPPPQLEHVFAQLDPKALLQALASVESQSQQRSLSKLLHALRVWNEPRARPQVVGGDGYVLGHAMAGVIPMPAGWSRAVQSGSGGEI